MPRAKKQADNETPMPTIENAQPKPAAAPAPAAPKPARRRRGFGSLLLLIALVAVSLWAYSLYNENRELRDPEVQARRIVAEMGRHILLPEDEVPGIFPIDKERAKEPFFKNAQTGDLLVVYRSTQQAFIYSPSRKILVNAGVLMVSPDQEQVPSGAGSTVEAGNEDEIPEGEEAVY
jgi:hypothetical protein